MQPTVDILTILTEIAPLVLSTLILSFLLIMVLWIVLKVVVPALRESVQMAEVQRQSWQSIVKEQQRLNTLMGEELQRDLTEERVERKKLAVRVEELSAELAKKDQRIAEMEAEISEMRKALDQRDQLIKTLREEVDREKAGRAQLERERAELLHRVEALEKAQKTETKPDGPSTPSTPASPGLIASTGGSA